MQLSMDESNLISYQDIKHKLRLFDLIAFRGCDIIISNIVSLEKYETGVGAFNDVNIIVTSHILPKCHINGNDLYLTPNHSHESNNKFLLPSSRPHIYCIENRLETKGLNLLLVITLILLVIVLPML